MPQILQAKTRILQANPNILQANPNMLQANMAQATPILQANPAILQADTNIGSIKDMLEDMLQKEANLCKQWNVECI